MLSNISWSSYITAVVVLVVLYYGFVLFRYCRSEITGYLKRKNKKDLLPADKGTGFSAEDVFGEFNEPFDTLEDAEELCRKLADALRESNDRDLSKVEFTNYLHFILAEYPFVKQSALRGKINSFMVSETAQYPRLMLTSSEMDALWDETIL